MNSKSLTAGQKKQDAQDKLERLLLRGRAVHPFALTTIHLQEH